MKGDFRAVQYYFWDLPCWSIGWRSARRWRRMAGFLQQDAENIRIGLHTLSEYREQGGWEGDLDEAIEKALLVRIARESDAFSCLGFPRAPHYEISGLAGLQDAIATKRPVILLSGHIGSFYTVAVALEQENIQVDQIARTVSAENRWPRKYYEKANYVFTQKAFSGKYIYSDFAGKVDRRIISTCKKRGVIFVANDLSRSLFPSGRRQVTFLGKRSSMTARTIELGIKYNAIFVMAWNKIELQDNFHFVRRLVIEPKTMDSTDVDVVLQEYADSLSRIVFDEPWQWAATQIASSYNEEES